MMQIENTLQRCYITHITCSLSSENLAAESGIINNRYDFIENK